MENGNCLEIGQDGAKLVGDVPSGNVLVDGLGIGDVGNIVLRDRKHLAEDGLVIVVVSISSSGEIISGPDIISRGFVYVRESGDLIEDSKSVVKKVLDSSTKKQLKDWTTLKTEIREELKSFIFQATKRNPMILPIIMEV